MRVIIFVLVSFINVVSYAQFNFEYSSDVQIQKNAEVLENAWAGGLNYVQFSEIDIDFDNDMDLFVFDRTNDNIKVFRNDLVNGTRSYNFVYNAKLMFPTNMRYRVFMIDYNGDGKNDIFTYGIGGLKVYKNTGNQTNGLQWELVSNLLFSQYPFSFSNLYVSSADLPGIVDVDNDGDIDVLTFSLGGSHLEYHKNLSQELYGHSDSLVFELKNACWGKFSEDPNNNNVILNDLNPPCNSGGVGSPEKDEPILPKLHAGSTILALDLDANGVMDLVLGDILSTNLVKLINGGSAPNTNSSMISAELNFPSNTTPVNLQLFPGAFYLDVDFDGKKDLIVSANAKNASENEKSIQFYKNVGQNNQPVFLFQERDFLQNEMIDHGTGSIPLFFDQNNDGKKDLIIGNFFRYKDVLDKESSVAIYRNTSTGSSTEFTFIDDDFLNLSSANLGLRSVPSFGDLDGDSDEDMILTRENGTIVYYQNIGTTGNAVFAPPSAPLQTSTGTVINEDTFPFSQLFDLNNDGLLDIIVGRRSGELVYYQNTGTPSTAVFTKMNSQLGNVDVSSINSPDGYAAPHFFRFNDTTHLFLGALDGKLHYYRNIDGRLATDSSFQLVSSNFLNIDVDGYSSFYVNDIDADGFLDLFVGTDLGGMLHLEVDPNSTASVEKINTDNFQVFPNPSIGKFQITSANTEIKNTQLFDVQGKEVRFIQSENSNGITVEIDNPKSGVYYLYIGSEKGRSVKKLIVL